MVRGCLCALLSLIVLSGCFDGAGSGDDGRADRAAEGQASTAPSGTGEGAAPAAQLEAPPGFEVTVFHAGVGENARHLVVRDNGDVLISRRDGVLVALRDSNGDGVADQMEERELPISTGLAIQGGHLYFSDPVSVSRIRLGGAELMPRGAVEAVVGGFPVQTSHATKTLAFDDDGNLYVNVGAPSNACQEQARTPGSPGQQPCPQLERQASIWKFPAGATGLSQTDGERYVTGTRNVVAMDWNHTADALFFAMHGRDQLNSLWPDLFDAEQNAEMVAEEFHRAVPDASYGWPYTFFDPQSGRRLIAPEYGGDGSQEAEAGRHQAPLYAFPGHWAPNDLVFYDADGFPERYRGGAFIAWHGSWNRAPLPQQGFRVTFLPFANGSPAGDPEDFLTGFQAAERADESDADYRPSGLGVGPIGELYVTETQRGRVWRVSYRG